MTSLTKIDAELLEIAFTHRSFLNEHENIKVHNERLEFLGDAVLELVTSQYLFKLFPSVSEGQLTAYRAALVKTTTLADMAVSLGFGNKIRMSKGEELTGGRQNVSILADTFEAVLGAMYLSLGLLEVENFLNEVLFVKIEMMIKNKLFKDFKSSLQERVQSMGFNSPEYKVVEESGPDHNKIFTVGVWVNKEMRATGQGKNKQEAQQVAAKRALEIVGKN